LLTIKQHSTILPTKRFDPSRFLSSICEVDELAAPTI
jgi:hypothetical protein